MVSKREVRSWLLYDWANSAYVLTVATAVMPAYFAGAVVPKQGWTALGQRFDAATLWAVAVGVAALLVFTAAPVLGAAADASGLKKRFLGVFAMAGGFTAMLMAATGAGDVLASLGLFVAAQFCFAGANVFYDAFLPSLGRAGELDRISARGFAWGYVGGGLQFALSLAVVMLHDRLGLSKDGAARLAMASAGLWWMAFSLPALMNLREKRPAGTSARPGPAAMTRQGLAGALEALKAVASNPPLRRFLIAYLLYNDGVQTVIAMAAIYGKTELGLSQAWLMGTLLLVQAVGVFGALAFARLAEAVGTKKALIASLGLWTLVVAWGAFIDSGLEFLALGAAIGLVLGGTQSLSRSMYAAMIPARSPARYFGFFSVVTKLSAVMGPFVFAAVRHTTGSSRPAVPVIALLFLSGAWMLAKWRTTGPPS